MDKMREEFEAWLGIKPCGAAHDLAWDAWQAARAKNVAAIDTSSEHVEKAGGNRQVEPVAWLDVEMGAAYTAEELADGGDFIPLYTAPPAQVPEGWRNSLMAAFPLFDDDGLDEVKHHCEWHLQQDRKRLHAMLSATPSAQVPDECQLVEQLADALRNVEEEMRLLSWQKSIELRRPAGSFGIAVKNDPLALEWQEVDSKLQDLYAKRRAALDAATQPKGGE